MKKKFTFTVDRRTWLRGTSKSALLKTSGKHKGEMCCLCHCAIACGFTKKDIANKPMPSAIFGKKYKCVEPVIDTMLKPTLNNAGYYDTDTVCRIAATNDDKKIGDTERERRLEKLFAELNIKIKFAH